MNKLKKAIKGLSAVIKNPYLLNLVISDNTYWESHLLKKKHRNALPIVDVKTLFGEINENINTYAFLDGGSLPTDILLLKLLAKRFKDCKYFEIGTWRGESVANVAEVAKECYTLNLSREEIINLGLSEKYADLHAFFSKNVENIKHLYGNTLQFDFESLGAQQKFDLIFIDGDHHYDYVKKDTENVFRHLVHENSIVVWHDYGYSSAEVRKEVYAAILDGIPADKHENLYHVSNSLCAIYTREKPLTYQLEVPAKPNKKFQINIRTCNLG